HCSPTRRSSDLARREGGVGVVHRDARYAPVVHADEPPPPAAIGECGVEAERRDARYPVAVEGAVLRDVRVEARVRVGVTDPPGEAVEQRQREARLRAAVQRRPRVAEELTAGRVLDLE